MKSLLDSNTVYRPLRVIVGKISDWSDLVKQCVAFANSSGGRLLIGIAEGEALPPAGQKVPESVVLRVHKRIREQTTNVELRSEVVLAGNGAEYASIRVSQSPGVALTNEGRYFIWTGEGVSPLVGAEVLRLGKERPGVHWETIATDVPLASVDKAKLAAFRNRVEQAGRFPACAELADPVLLQELSLGNEGYLTCLGVLLLGSANDRQSLEIAPVIQLTRIDAQGDILSSEKWDDPAQSILDMLDAVGKSQTGAHAHAVMELLVNAVAHRMYNQSEIIRVNQYADRIEVINAGRLPVGIIPYNILHSCCFRNPLLVRVMQTVGLMGGEGLGFDRIYAQLLSQGYEMPQVEEVGGEVVVSLALDTYNTSVCVPVADAIHLHALTRSEQICLALLAQHGTLTAYDLAQNLALADMGVLQDWLGRLPELGLVLPSGKGTGLQYRVSPILMPPVLEAKQAPLERIDPLRLRQLVCEDVLSHPDTTDTEVGRRIRAVVPAKITARMIKHALGLLAADNLISVNKMRNQWRYDPPV